VGTDSLMVIGIFSVVCIAGNDLASRYSVMFYVTSQLLFLMPADHMP
jgi:hypothetical protein